MDRTLRSYDVAEKAQLSTHRNGSKLFYAMPVQGETPSALFVQAIP